MSDLMLDVSQAVELKMAFRRAGYTNAQIKQLSEGDFLSNVKDVLEGYSKINPFKHIIDCNVDWMTDSKRLIKHEKAGMFIWNPDLISLYPLNSDGKKLNTIGELCKNLHKKKALNANVLDYLLDHQHLIPKSWKDYWILFPGTIYKSDIEGLKSLARIPALYFGGEKWHQGNKGLNDELNSFTFVAILEN